MVNVFASFLLFFSFLFHPELKAAAANYDDVVKSIEAYYEHIRDENSQAMDTILDPDFSDLFLTFNVLGAMTLNLGLLNHFAVQVPYYQERSDSLYSALAKFTQQEYRPSIIFLQELWYRGDFKTVEDFSRDFHYSLVLGDYDRGQLSRRGLQILVDRDIITASPPLHSFFAPYEDKAWWESIPFIADYDRGALLAVVELEDGTSLLLANTHFTPMIWENEVRRKQVRSLAKILDDKARSYFVDFTLLGGDLNFTPDFTPVDELKRQMWEKGRDTYLLFVDEAQFVDTYKAVNTDSGLSYDTAFNTLASDGISQGKPSQRLDYIWIKRGKSSHSGASFAVLDSTLTFDTPIDGGNLFLSDHYGVLSEVALFSIE